MAFEVGAIVSKLQLRKDQWDASIKKVKADQKSLSGLVLRNSQQFKKMGRSMTIAGGVVVGAVSLMVKAYANFDQAMTESLAIMGDISDEMREDMSNVAKTISEETTFSAKELAASYFFLASAGMDASQSMAVLGDVARFAQAGTFNLSTATDLLTDAQTAMGLSSKNAIENQKELIRVSDVLVGANTLANASVQQFAEALTTKAAAALVNVNKEMEEGVAVLAAFADKGIKGRLAGTQLGMMLNALDLAAMRNKKAWKAHGLTLWTSTGQMKSMGEIIGELEDKLGDMTPEMRSATLAQLGFTIKTKASVLTLMGSSEKIKKWTEDLKHMGGITKTVSDKQLKTLNNQLKLLRNTIVNAAISIGETLAPTIEELIVKVKDIAKKVSNWIKEHPKLTKWIGLTALKVGGLLLVLGPLLMMLPGLIQGMNFLGISSAKAALGMKALLGPIGMVAGAALVAYNITKKLIEAKEDLIDADKRAFDITHKMGQKLREIADAAGLTRKEYIELTRKYKGNTNALAIAILKGKEGIELQKAMKKYGKEHREEVGKGTTAIDKLTKAFMEGEISLEEYQERLKALSKTTKKVSEEVVSMIKTMTDEIKKATLDEFEYRKLKAQEIYEERKALLEEEDADGKAFILLEKTRATTLAEIEEDITKKQREEVEKRETLLKDFAAKVSKARDEYWRRIKEKYESFKGYVSKYTDIIKQHTLSETDYKRLKLKEWYDNQIKLLKASLGNTKKYHEAKALLDEAYSLKAIELTKDTTDTITIRFKSMIEHVLDFTRDLAAGWADVFVDMLGITESITYQMKEFDNSYWESALQNAQETYEEKKSLLEKQLDDAIGYYENLEGQLTEDYEKRKQWIEANVTDEEKKQEMLLKLEQKHQANLEQLRADRLKKEEDLQNNLVELEENHQTESERIRGEEDAAREQHADDEYDRQNSLWNKVKGVFGDAVDNMLYTWTTDLIQGMLIETTKLAKGLVSELAGAFKTVKNDAVSTASKVTSEVGGIAGLISGIGTAIAGVITTLATAIATAATTLAAAAPALLTVLGIALAAYAGFKLISSLFKKKPKTGTMEAILGDIAYVFLHAICLKLDGLNDHVTNFFPKIDYQNSILAKIENINKGIRGYSKKINDGVKATVKKLGDLSGFQTGIAHVPETQLAMVHAGETIIPPPGTPERRFIPRETTAGTGRQYVHVTMKPLLIPRGDKYIVDFVIEDIKHGRKIPIEAIGG